MYRQIIVPRLFVYRPSSALLYINQIKFSSKKKRIYRIILYTHFIIFVLLYVFPNVCKADSPELVSTDLRYQILQSAKKHCEEIPQDKYVTGLLFNGPGMHTYYEQSYCFQELAVQERLISLCQIVKERKSLFISGSHVSPQYCEQEVNKAIDMDKQKADMLRSHQGTILDSVDITGVIEYDKVTNSRSLILRSKVNDLDWPFYKFVIEFCSGNGNVLARYSEAPRKWSGEVLAFIIRFIRLEADIGEHLNDEIKQIVVSSVLERNADTAHVMKYIHFEELDRVVLKFDEFDEIRDLGPIKFTKWKDLLDNEYWESGTAFFKSLDELVK